MSGGAVVAVAASGGRDSTALLHATARAARDLGLQVVALHVHHALMPLADDWLRHLRAQCARWRRGGLPVTLSWRHLSERPAPGESIEAWARRQRYAALAQMAREAGATLVLLAHHRQDQAETFLLQALRGAGPRGLSGMPRIVERDGLRWARPWLDVERAAIDAYLRRHRLRHIDDASNRQPRYARSRLRRRVWPGLVAAFPDAATALGAAAKRAVEAAQCVDELATLDARSCVDTQGRLQLEPWSRLSDARRRNLLRWWLRRCLGRGAAESLVHRLANECMASGSGARWLAGDGQILRHRGVLMWLPAPATATPIAAVDSPVVRLDLSRPGVHDAGPWRGRFRVEAAEGAGAPAALLAHCELRQRRGSEQFQRAPGTPPRSLKKQFQLAGVPPHERHGPLVYAAGELVFVPGLGIDARALRSSGSERRTIAWLPERE